MSITQISLEQLKSELASTQVTRGIQEVVLHHTWSPDTTQYRGKATWEAIRNYHVRERGWSDIGYHYGVGPEGSVWRLRPLTRAGAHVLNRNQHTVGVVLLGNFDVEDPLIKGLPTAAQVTRALVERFKLTAGQIRFHREFQPKTCPGTRINLAEFRTMVMSNQGQLPGKQAVSEGTKNNKLLKVVMLPENNIILCRPELKEGKVRCDLRALAEELGAEVTDHIADQGKVYLKKLPPRRTND
jgi:hypothetical protein